MYTIALHDLDFFAFHGLYEEEKLSGNHFSLDVIVEVESENYKKERLDLTVDYEKLFVIVKANMNKTCLLLETVLENIHKDIMKQYPFVVSIDVKINKLNPPIIGMKGRSAVQLKKTYNASV